MGVVRHMSCSVVLGVLLGACHNVTNECPVVSQWWYHGQPKKPIFSEVDTGVRHDPSTITSVGHR